MIVALSSPFLPIQSPYFASPPGDPLQAWTPAPLALNRAASLVAQMLGEHLRERAAEVRASLAGRLHPGPAVQAASVDPRRPPGFGQALDLQYHGAVRGGMPEGRRLGAVPGPQQRSEDIHLRYRLAARLADQQVFFGRREFGLGELIEDVA